MVQLIWANRGLDESFIFSVSAVLAPIWPFLPHFVSLDLWLENEAPQRGKRFSKDLHRVHSSSFMSHCSSNKRKKSVLIRNQRKTWEESRFLPHLGFGSSLKNGESGMAIWVERVQLFVRQTWAIASWSLPSSSLRPCPTATTYIWCKSYRWKLVMSE